MERAIEQSLFGELFTGSAPASTGSTSATSELTGSETLADSSGVERVNRDDLDDPSASASEAELSPERGGLDSLAPSLAVAEIPTRVLAPMLQQYADTKAQYPEHLLLFQVGDFYEIFFDDAKIASEVLQIRLTSRDKDPTSPIPMCGVPIHALDNYLPRLLKGGYSCVVVSQLDDGRSKKGPVRREITRIVTPGVRFEGDGLDEKQFNYLAALCVSNSGFGAIAFVDVSTGHLRVAESESIEGIEELLRRVAPSELIVPSSLFDVPVSARDGWLRTVQQVANSLGTRLVRRPFTAVARAEVCQQLLTMLRRGGDEQAGVGVADNLTQRLEGLPPTALATVLAAVGYVEEVSFTARPSLSEFSIELPTTALLVDSITRRNLELTHNRQTGERKHSLLAAIDYTKTAMGCRMLTEWLIAPSRDIEEISARHDAVAELVERVSQVEELRALLLGVRDLDRLASRITSARANPSDLRMLCDSLKSLPAVGQLLQTFQSTILQELGQQFDSLQDLTARLDSALVEEPPIRSNEGGIFKDGFDSEIDSLRRIRGDGRAWLLQLEQQERERSGISGLKIKYNNVFGYFIEVSKAHLSKVPSSYERKQTLANAERFVTQDLKEKEVALLGAKARQVELERELFVELRLWVAERAGRVQKTSRILSQLDVLGSFAFLAERHKYCRPTMRTDQELIIENGRHPVVEQVLGAHRFVPNDCYLNGAARRFAILTGPNMGGKSTYLRQIGLIQLLAQAGSFVPADRAELGVVDRIFTRIGAADDLARGDSTFMVEMREAAVILRKATSRSLVLIDEVGRGTATSDGLAIATAVAEWLHDAVACRTVFATHFHQLTELQQQKDGAFCLSVGVIEVDGDISFTHRIEERAADKSYGIEVARLAGLPEKLLQRAEQVLAQLDEAELDFEELNQQVAGPPKAGRENTVRTSAEVSTGNSVLRDAKVRAILERLREFQPERIAPLQALVELAELRQLVEDLERA